MTSQIIAKITHGSQLFGTSTETSDVDLKTIFTPSAMDILLGRVATSNRDGTSNLLGKNTKDDTDQDNHDLIKFMRLIQTGSPEAFEVLFAPTEFHLEQPSEIWNALYRRRHEFVHADLVPFERLIRHNSKIIVIGEDEENAARKVHAILTRVTRDTSKKKSILPYVDEIIAAIDNPAIVRKEARNGRDGTSHDVLVIAHKAMPVGESFNFGLKLTETIATEAVMNQSRNTLSHDQWKHLSMAVRFSSEMIELLETGNLTFPRPEREVLYDIKTGKAETEAVKERLCILGNRIQSAKIGTSLPASANQEMFENFIADAHLTVIHNEFGDLRLGNRPNKLSLS
jgi:hypothetical protein